MFKLIGMSGFLAVALACAPAAAQNAPPPADQTAPPPADQGPPPGAASGGAPPPGAAAGGKPTGKELIAGCRSDARAKGLTGAALKAAVDDCVGAQRPKLAARLQCRQQGKAQGLAGDELKSFVQNCVAQGPQSGGQSMAPPAGEGPPPGAASGEAPPPGAAMGGKPSAKELIAGCRADARGKGLTGDALKAAVDECVGAQRPKVAARLQCRQQGKAQGLAGDELKAFVQNCVAQGSQPGGQSMAAPADQGPPANAAGEAPPPAAAAGGKPAAKELIAGCRSDARAKGLTGDALKAAIDECVGAQRPKLAARLQCRQQGKAQGLAGDELKSFVQNCVTQGQQ
jgi:hypothetical protein